MRLEWKGDDNGAPFSTRQTIDFRDLLPDAFTTLAVLNLRRVGEPGSGLVTLQMLWRNGVGNGEIQQLTLDLGDPDNPSLTKGFSLSKGAKNETQGAPSELLLDVIPEDGVVGSWTADLTIV